jgi:hypothetical protein
LYEALYEACEYGQLTVVIWLVEHTELRDDGTALERALVEASKYSQWDVVK